MNVRSHGSHALSLLCVLHLGVAGIAAGETASGLVLPREGGGMILRNAEGDTEVGWTDRTRVALEVKSSQLAQLAGVAMSPAEAARAAMTELERLSLDHPAETFAAAGVVVEAFLSAPDYQARLKFCRDPDRVRELMEDFYSREDDGAIEFRKPEDGWRMRPYRSFLLTQVELGDFSARPIALERQADGSYLVDWESYVAYCEIPWEKFQKDRPAEGFTVRTRASVGDYFNSRYPSSDWACMKLEDSTQEHLVYGYIKLDSPLMGEMRRVVTLSGSNHLTLEVAYPEDAEAGNQLLISGIITKGWVPMAPEPAPSPRANAFQFEIPWSEQVIEFPVPDGLIGLQVSAGEVGQALALAEAEGRIEVGALRLRLGLERVAEHLPKEFKPSFSGRWIPGEGSGKLEIKGRSYALSTIGGGQPDALLFNLLSTADCQPFVNRASVSGRRDGDQIIADEIHLRPIGDQAALDDPDLPRYLCIGDSISGNYSPGLRSALAGKFNVHHPPTNCGPSGFGRGQIVEWLGAYGEEGRHWDVISFNFGHWDAGNSRADYQANLEAIITELEGTGAQLVWVTTCPVPGGVRPVGELTPDGKAPGQSCGVMRKFLNPWATEVIARHPEISTCDQWSFVNDHADDLYRDWWTGTDVHFGGEQAAALGEFLGQHILEVTGR